MSLDLSPQSPHARQSAANGRGRSGSRFPWELWTNGEAHVVDPSDFDLDVSGLQIRLHNRASYDSKKIAYTAETRQIRPRFITKAQEDGTIAFQLFFYDSHVSKDVGFVGPARPLGPVSDVERDLGLRGGIHLTSIANGFPEVLSQADGTPYWKLRAALRQVIVAGQAYDLAEQGLLYIGYKFCRVWPTMARVLDEEHPTLIEPAAKDRFLPWADELEAKLAAAAEQGGGDYAETEQQQAWLPEGFDTSSVSMTEAQERVAKGEALLLQDDDDSITHADPDDGGEDAVKAYLRAKEQWPDHELIVVEAADGSVQYAPGPRKQDPEPAPSVVHEPEPEPPAVKKVSVPVEDDDTVGWLPRQLEDMPDPLEAANAERARLFAALGKTDPDTTSR